MRLFNELKADFPEGTTFDQAKPTLLQVPNLRRASQLRNELEKAFQSYDISISPMYAAQVHQGAVRGSNRAAGERAGPGR